MLFNSILFFVFLYAVFTIYWSSPQYLRKYVLIIASLVFYATWGLLQEGLPGIRWSIHFVSVVIFSHFTNFLLFRFPSRKKWILIFEIAVLTANLSFFKYDTFFLTVLKDAGIITEEKVNGTSFLPLAISFYTFQIIAYSVDIYRGIIKEKKSFSDYFLFILFFPQLIAGPIMRYHDFFGQTPVLKREYVYSGIWLIMGGLVKKVLIADPMGNLIQPVFLYPETFAFYQILLGGAGFAIQVYCDFSGYTDIARGSAYLLGYEIPENFVAPFFSVSAREVWQRWHITLATWLRDYIYIPLGGSKVSEIRTYLNQIFTFALGGLWHGADYTYLAWGTFWGVLLAGERFLEKTLKLVLLPNNVFLKIAKGLLIFYFFTLGALMFRSQSVTLENTEYRSVEIMLQLLTGSFTHHHDKLREEFLQKQGDVAFVEAVMGKQFFSPNTIPHLETYTLYVLLTLFFHWLQFSPRMFERWKYNTVFLVSVAVLLFGFVLPAFASTSNQFIYFVF